MRGRMKFDKCTEQGTKHSPTCGSCLTQQYLNCAHQLCGRAKPLLRMRGEGVLERAPPRPQKLPIHGSGRARPIVTDLYASKHDVTTAHRCARSRQFRIVRRMEQKRAPIYLAVRDLRKLTCARQVCSSTLLVSMRGASVPEECADGAQRRRDIGPRLPCCSWLVRAYHVVINGFRVRVVSRIFGQSARQNANGKYNKRQ